MPDQPVADPNPRQGGVAAEVPPVLAALRERLTLRDDEVAALIDYAVAHDVGVYDGSEWDDDAFHEWLTDEVWNHVSPSYKRVLRIQTKKGWTLDV